MNDITTMLDMMQSDFKLWEKSETVERGDGVVEKTITLPWGIGPVSVVLEGMNNAGKRREAVGAYGDYIRGLINDRINDESVTARAQQAAARAEQDDSGGSDDLDGVGVQGPQATPQADVAAGPEDKGYAEDTSDLGATLTARRTALRERVGRVEADLARWRRELKALDAAVAALEDD
jgi:hypothetical protein